MTSQRNETTHAPAGEEMTDDPIIIERRDEVIADGSLEGAGVAEDETASDELIGRHAAADTGDADPAPLVVPPDVPRAGAADPSAAPGSAAPASAVAGSGAPASAVAGSGEPRVDGIADPAVPGPAGAGTGDPAAGTTGNGIPATALSEQQWPAIQAMFVDDPQASVQRAAAAAEEVAKAFIASLQREQVALRASWQDAGGATTEDLRTALQQYRAFCGRLEGLA
jgi:hypothetical protein